MKYLPQTTDFIDIHSHHSDQEKGVFRIHNIFSSDFQKVQEGVPVSIGLHPWHVSVQTIKEMPGAIKQALTFRNTIAIGEAGLDRFIQVPIEQQIAIFRIQAEISMMHNKPLIIHCVKAFPELLSLRKEFSNAERWIIHGYTGNQTIAAECVKNGIYISLSQRLFRNPFNAKKIVTVVPLTMIFAETDEDTVTIQEIYQTISSLYGVSLEEIKQNIFENFNRIFIF